MAEDLGRILIDFGKLGGGGSTGPEPTQTKETPSAGGIDINTIIKAIMGDVSAIIKLAVQVALSALRMVVQKIQEAIEFVKDTVSEIREAGRFSPEVMMENAATQIQQIQQQLREAKILGPLYATILRWYRELMRLLEPWKLLLSAIFSFLAGALIQAFSGFMSIANTVLVAILKGVMVVIAYLRDVASKVAATQVGGSAFMAVAFPQLSWLWNKISGGNSNISANVSSAAGALDAMLQQMQQVLAGVLSVASNTAPSPSGADWAATQLREIASRSPLYPKAGPTPTFWNPPGSTYP
jgi:hypothetical protein